MAVMVKPSAVGVVDIVGDRLGMFVLIEFVDECRLVLIVELSLLTSPAPDRSSSSSSSNDGESIVATLLYTLDNVDERILFVLLVSDDVDVAANGLRRVRIFDESLYNQEKTNENFTNIFNKLFK
jgi:SpoVK/Ycf46/Vps4 family AAA+-type ATPase